MPDGEILIGEYQVEENAALGVGFAGTQSFSMVGFGSGRPLVVSATGDRGTIMNCAGTSDIGGHGFAECSTSAEQGRRLARNGVEMPERGDGLGVRGRGRRRWGLWHASGRAGAAHGGLLIDIRRGRGRRRGGKGVGHRLLTLSTASPSARGLLIDWLLRDCRRDAGIRYGLHQRPASEFAQTDAVAGRRLANSLAETHGDRGRNLVWISAAPVVK